MVSRARGRASALVTLCVAVVAILGTHGGELDAAGKIDAVASTRSPPWWRNAVIYEIYPRSFQDSNADGAGDLRGVIQRLDYLQWLGVQAIWLTPVYPSPQADFGYDITDFRAIDPVYGTLQDLHRLLVEARARGIRLVMDLVLNHTSDEHPWFRESARGRSSPRHDWYIWRDGKRQADGTVGAPNNWRNRIAQDAWTYSPENGQFYYHFYDPKEPDLNWRNPEVQSAMFAAARFWLDQGVAGFRLDAINTLFENSDLTDEPPSGGTNEYGEPGLSQIQQRNRPEVHGVLRDLRAVAAAYPGDRVLIGEIYTSGTAELAAWYGGGTDPELHLPMNTNVGFLNRLDAGSFRRLLEESETHLATVGNTPLFVFDNHDRPRSWDRYGDGRHNLQIAKIVAAILLASHASALVYQGQEIGMGTTTPSRKEDVRDPRGIAGWPGEKGRDGERTPMQWDGSANAGFSRGAKPWLPIPASFEHVNVAQERNDPQSLLRWYRDLIALRRRNEAVREGSTAFLDRDAQRALVWVRIAQNAAGDSRAAVIVACNLSDDVTQLNLAGYVPGTRRRVAHLRKLLSSTSEAVLQGDARILLPPFATFIGELR